MAKFNDGDQAVLRMPGDVVYTGHVKATGDPTSWNFMFDDPTQPSEGIVFGETRLELP